MYRPYVVFIGLGSALFALAVIPSVRFLLFFFEGQGGGHLQSLIFASAMLVGSLLSFALAVISDLQRTSRILAEEQLERAKEMQYRQ